MARKQNLETTIESNRPPVSAGRLDQRLAGLALALRGVVAETQEMFIYPACQLDNDSLDELAVARVEFAEDIHAGIGLAGIGKLPERILRHAAASFPRCRRAALGKVRSPPRPAFPLHAVPAIKAGSYSRPGPPRPYGTGGDAE